MKTTTEATANIVYRERLEIAQRSRCSRAAGSRSRWSTTELFPGAAKQMFKVGEETGTLDQQLEVASRVLRP